MDYYDSISFYHPYLEQWKENSLFNFVYFLLSVFRYLIIIRRRKTLLRRSFESEFHCLLSDPSEYSKKKISSDNQNQFNRKLISSQALTKILSSISSSFTSSFTSSFSKSIIRRLKHYQDHPFTLNFFYESALTKIQINEPSTIDEYSKINQ